MASFFAMAAAALDSVPVAVTRLAVLFLGAHAARALYKVAGFVAVYGRSSQVHRYVYRDTQGHPPWALVTGASDGVGAALADALAAAGLNIVLHGRNPAKLERVRVRLLADHPQRQFRLLVADAAQPPGPALDRLVETVLGDIHLTMLVNNAGGSLHAPTYASLAETTTARIVENVMLNSVFPLVLTARVLELFQRQASAGAPGAPGPTLVMNIGSLSDIGLPFVTPYAASKALMLAATSMVRRELQALGQASTRMLAVRLGTVTGVSHNKTPPRWTKPDATTMARAALARTGSGRDVVIGYLPHALQNALLNVLTPGMTDRLYERVMLARRAKDLDEMAGEKKAL